MTPLEAMQATLAGEHAAVYVYGVLGGRVSASAHPELAVRLRDAYAIHRDRRDALTTMIRDEGAAPVAAEVSYELPNPAMSPGQLERAALEVEGRCADVYAQMVGATAHAARRWSARALTDAAVRLLGFGGTPEAFPGIAELPAQAR